MKKEPRLSYNLQFFSEGGVNEPEPAEPDVDNTSVSETNVEVSEDGTGVNDTGAAAPEPQSAETNAIYADARRKAEEEARRKFDLQQQARDRAFAERFKGLTNPKTGRPIASERDYFDALDAQEQMATEKMLADKGLSTDFLDKVIANNPAVRQAQEILAQTQKYEAERQLNAEVAEISRIDPTITSLSDLVSTEYFGEIMNLVNRQGMSVLQAYKIVNFDSIGAKKADAARQAAINQARSKDHLETSNSVTVQEDKMVDIPQKDLAFWKECYPNLSAKELKAKYNAVI